MRRSALITGVGGQDGILLAQHLLGQGYRVAGTVRPGGRGSARSVYLTGVDVRECDVRDSDGFATLLEDVRPDQIYNLAAFSSMVGSWENRDVVTAVNADAVESMVQATATHAARHHSSPRFFQASSSAVYGSVVTGPCTESTPHHPESPYAEAKSRAHRAAAEARDRDGLFVSVGVLFNHESPLRGHGFVSRRVSRAVAAISEGHADELVLGDLSAARDWGAAKDHVRAMHLAMTHDIPDDYVLATGRVHTVKDLVEAAFAAAELPDPWVHVRQDPARMRSADVPGLAGDTTHATDTLGWRATTSFDEMVAQMVSADVRRLRSGVEESADYLP